MEAEDGVAKQLNPEPRWYGLLVGISAIIVLAVFTSPFWIMGALFGSTESLAKTTYTIDVQSTDFSRILLTIDKLVPKHVSSRIDIIETYPGVYEHRYNNGWWYAINSSEYYGIGIVEYNENLKTRSANFEIEIYTPGVTCDLCDLVTNALNAAEIQYIEYRKPVYSSDLSRKFRRENKDAT